MGSAATPARRGMGHWRHSACTRSGLGPGARRNAAQNGTARTAACVLAWRHNLYARMARQHVDRL
eukprot:343626-Lingulodinium_polyedra.AAC.1